MRRAQLLAAASALVLAAAPCLALAGDADAPADKADKADKEEVVITAAPYAVSLDTVTSSVNVVGRDALDVAPAVGLGDALNGQPGLRSTSFGPGASRPVIRGLSGPRVLVLQNGVGMVDASSLSPDHAVASDPADAQRIEVLRGPSTLAYGGSGIGGVVNVIDDRVPTHPLDGVEGRASASVSSVDDGAAGSVELKAGTGPFVAALSASHRRSRDYDIPVPAVSDRLAARDGLTIDPVKRMLNSDVEYEEYGIGGSWVHDRGYLGASLRKTDTTYGVPGEQILAPIDPNAEGPVGIHLKQTRLDLRGEQEVGLGPIDKVRLSVGWADYEHAEVSREDGEVGTRFLSDGTEGRLEFVQTPWGNLQGAVGLQGLKRSFEAIGDEAFVPPVDIDEVGVFTLQRYDAGQWGVDLGLRFDRRSIAADLAGRPNSQPAIDNGIDWAGARADRSFSNVSASVGVFYKPMEDLFLALSLSHNGRAPTEFELYADGPHPGTGGYELGDPTLSSERVNSVEATVRWTGDRLRAEGHLWHADYDGFIEEAPTGALEDDLPVFRYFQTGAAFHGAEAEVSYALWRQDERSITGTLTYDQVHGDTDAGPPARTPPWSLTGKLAWTGPYIEAHAEVRHVAAQDRVAAFELPTDGYTTVGAFVAWRPYGDPRLRLFVEGRNLGDVEAREHVSFLKDVSPQPGRSIRMGAAYRF